MEHEVRAVLVAVEIFKEGVTITRAVRNLHADALLLWHDLPQQEDDEEKEDDEYEEPWVAVTREGALTLDPSVRDVLDLPPGWEAHRTDATAAWERRPMYSRSRSNFRWWPLMLAVLILSPLGIVASNGFRVDLLGAAIVGFAEGLLALAILYFPFRWRWHAAAGWFGEAEAQRMWEQTAAEEEHRVWSTLWLVFSLGVVLLLGGAPVFVLRWLNIPPDPDYLGIGVLAGLAGFIWGLLRLWNWLIQQRDQKLDLG